MGLSRGDGVSAQSRYWVSFKRGFDHPLAPENADETAAYFARVHVGLRRLEALITDASVALSDSGGITLSGVVRAADQQGALAAASEAFNKALAEAGHLPDLPPAPHTPSWRAHELLGVADSSVRVLSAA